MPDFCKFAIQHYPFPTHFIAALRVGSILSKGRIGYFASKLGVPVSTTHVSVGSIAGVGMRAQTLDWTALRQIMLSWLATLPLAALLSWTVSGLV